MKKVILLFLFIGSLKAQVFTSNNTSVTIKNPSVTVLNPSVTVLNPVSTVTVSNTVTASVSGTVSVLSPTLTSIKLSNDTVNQNLRSVRSIQSNSLTAIINSLTIISNTLTTNVNTLTIIKQKNDTINQNLRSLRSISSLSLTALKVSSDTTNQGIRNLNPPNSVLTATSLTGASIAALLTTFNTWRTNNPAARIYRVELTAPSAVLREMLIEFKP